MEGTTIEGETTAVATEEVAVGEVTSQTTSFKEKVILSAGGWDAPLLHKVERRVSAGKTAYGSDSLHLTVTIKETLLD